MPQKVFTEKDYNSGDGMMTSIWGPPLWHTLHTISFNYPVKPTKEEKDNYYLYFKSLQGVLPCRYCRDNLKKNWKSLPLKKSIFKNRETLSKYVYDLHELVNKMLNKKSTLSYEQIKDRYENFRSRCLDKKKNNSKKELGCTSSLYGVKGKCVLNIVPKNNNSSIKIDPKCKVKNFKK